jgi:pyroglutamyl-peptidase
MKQVFAVLCIGILLLLCSSVTSSGSCAPVVLVTGFEPFQNYTVNPSEVIAEQLNGTYLSGANIIGIVLPVDFNESFRQAALAIEQYQPVLVISVGLAGTSHTIKVEKIGLNMKRYPKDDGTWSFPRRVEKPGPFLRISPLRTNDIVRNIRNANISVQQSFFAGTYVCNSLFYQLLGYTKEHNGSIQVGFIHVPLLDSQDAQGMALETEIQAVRLAITASLS